MLFMSVFGWVIIISYEGYLSLRFIAFWKGKVKNMQTKLLNGSTCLLERESSVSIVIPDSPYVLVIDDDDSILSVVLLLLEMEEHTALGMADSTKVVPLLEGLDSKHFPRVILLDLMMP